MIVIADDIMIVGKQQNHKDQDLALTTLLDTTGKCKVRLNFDKLQYEKNEVDFIGIHILQVDASLPKAKYLLLQECQLQPVKSKCSYLLEW